MEVPPGFVFNSEFGDYENPQTGEWFDPESGQIYAADAPPAESGGYGSGAGGVGALGAGYLAYDGLSGPTPSLGAPTVPNVVEATNLGPATEALPAWSPTGSAAGAPAASSGMIPPSVMEYAGPLALAGLAAYTGNKGYDAWKNSQYSAGNPMTGLKEGIKAAGPLNFVPVLGQLPWLAGAAGAFFGSGKDKNQHERDQLRQEMIDSGFLPEDYNMSLSSGASLDFGKDGGAMLDNYGQNIDGKSQRHYYDVDFSRPGSDRLTAWLDPLGEAIADSHGGGKRRENMTGYLTNLAQMAGDEGSNAKELIDKAGFNHDTLYGWVHLNEAKLGKDRADAYKNSLDELYGVGAYAGGKKQEKQNSSPAPQNMPQPQVQASSKTDLQPMPKDNMKSNNEKKKQTIAQTAFQRRGMMIPRAR